MYLLSELLGEASIKVASWHTPKALITYPVTYPTRNLLLMERTYYKYIYLYDREAGTILTYVGIIHLLLRRFDTDTVNQYQLLFRSFKWVA